MPVKNDDIETVIVLPPKASRQPKK